MIKESVNTSNNVTGTGTGVIVKYNVPVQTIDYDEYDSRIRDKYAKPYANLVWSIGFGNFTSSSYIEYTSESGNRETPLTVSIEGSKKEYSENNTGFNIKGIAPRTWGLNSTGNPDEDSLDILTETWLSFNSKRSRYLIPGKDWHVIEYKINYITIPTEIFIDTITPSNQRSCILGETVHQDIVDLAVELASKSITPEEAKNQVNSNKTQMNE